MCGLQDSRIQRELLCIRDLSLAQAQDKARSMEIVLKETVELRQKEPDVSVEAGNDEELRRHIRFLNGKVLEKVVLDVGAQTTGQQTVFTKIKNAITVGR